MLVNVNYNVRGFHNMYFISSHVFRDHWTKQQFCLSPIASGIAQPSRTMIIYTVYMTHTSVQWQA